MRNTTRTLVNRTFKLGALGSALTLMAIAPAEAASASTVPVASTAISSQQSDRQSATNTESITAEQIKTLNQAMKKAGKGTIPEATTHLKYFNDGSVIALDESGAKVGEIATGSQVVQQANAVADGAVASDSTTSAAARGLLHPEVKRVIGACLGFGGAGAMSFEALVQKLATPQNAVKFVVRRLGVFGAVSCAGGIVWEYI